jgi:DnaJ-class molecular chaperone
MISLTKPCNKCKGKGFSYVRDYFEPTEVVPEDCEYCDGSGKVFQIVQQGDGSFADRLNKDCCIKCHTFLDGALQCPTCKLVYGSINEKT